MAADPLDIVGSTADAAFAVDERGRIVIWNRGAEALLGYQASGILGRSCATVFCGRDVFGNRFCDPACAVQRMVLAHEAVSSFRLYLRKESGSAVPVAVSIITVPGPKASQHTVIHLLHPISDTVTSAAHAASLMSPAFAGSTDTLARPHAALSNLPLTEREVEILRVLADGRSTKDIADSLYISVTTVRNHVQNILRKLEVHSKVEAVSLALRCHLI